MSQYQLSEREMLEDSLSSQKQISSDYQAFASDCQDDQLRLTLMNILTDELSLSGEIFEAMDARGWNQSKQAKQSDIQKAKEKYIHTKI